MKLKLKAYLPVSLALILFAILFSCNSNSKKAEAILESKSGSDVKGKVTFVQEENSMLVIVDIEGLTPGKHGFHVHEKGDCSAEDGSSAGGHFNPKSMKHAGPDSPERHEGDLGNITADENGRAKYEFSDPMLSFEGESSIIGKSVIVHAKADDLTTQPTGDAGGRVACGIIN